MQLIINTADTRMTVKNKAFYIESKTRNRQISPKRITSIAVTVNCTINSAVIKLAALNEIPIYFFNNFGTMQARMWSPYFKNIATLRKKQILFYNTPQASNWVILTLTKKTNLQTETLQQLNKRTIKYAKQTETAIYSIKQILQKAQAYKNQPIENCRNNLLGIEGSICKKYYDALQVYLPESFRFKSRSRRPATDYFNAALNYLYGMTYSVVESGIFAKGLDPFTGYMHTDNYLKTALVFDLIEPIRPLIDRILIELCTEEKLNDTHFIPKEQGYWLSKTGKTVIIPSFNEYLYKRVKVFDKVRRIKDVIYHESNDLGNLIDISITL
ncbi:MAG: CRISPR-associated endonuclease Cas1 [Bacteroidales bacterium]|nr:CRISPR-associated endonuclease Cas1 [Bacteroidales bacterium]